MTENMIRVEHLTKSYRLYERNKDRIKEAINPFGKRYSRDFFALKDLSFSVSKGETIGIIGKNGAGKSTLLKILTGVITPTNGTVTVNGRIAALLELGAGFNPEMTGIENIYLNGTIMGCSKEEIDNKLAAILDFADIGEFVKQPVKMYSSGMFARLAFAVNANVEPDILIVDEALAVGDVFFQNKCFRKFEELRAKGTTILFVSHDIGSIKQLCTRAIWLENGAIKMNGNTDTVCDRYFNAEIEERNKTANLSNISTQCIELTNADNYKRKFMILENKKGDIVSECLKIRSFGIFDCDGKETNVMRANTRYDIHVLLEFSQLVQHCILGITLTNRKGVDILGTNTYQISHKKTFVGEKGDLLDVVFTFNMPAILPGTYIWDTAAANGIQAEHIILSWLHGVRDVEVINDNSNKLGIVDVQSSIKVEKLNVNE